MSFLFHFLFEVPFLSFWSFWGHCLSFLQPSPCAVFLALRFCVCVGGGLHFYSFSLSFEVIFLFSLLFWGHCLLLLRPTRCAVLLAVSYNFLFARFFLTFWGHACLFSSFLFWGHSSFFLFEDMCVFFFFLILRSLPSLFALCSSSSSELQSQSSQDLHLKDVREVKWKLEYIHLISSNDLSS